MKTIRTPHPYLDKDLFRIFLDKVDLTEVMIGDWTDWWTIKRICYAYSEKSDETVAIMTYITLKYGSLYDAFRKYMTAIETSTMNDPFFNWTP